MGSENVWEIISPDDLDQDNKPKLLNYCIVISPGQGYLDGIYELLWQPNLHTNLLCSRHTSRSVNNRDPIVGRIIPGLCHLSRVVGDELVPSSRPFLVPFEVSLAAQKDKKGW
ncbi:hypothetical protein TNCV_3554531 [Trichonephila clavipes]|nr:hypothetical protein TNCV_3554531 [Trichonephila clavipes]